MTGVRLTSRLLWLFGLSVACSIEGRPASAVVVELNDVAPDRIERQQREAVGQLPLPGTPNLAQFPERLKEKGLALGSDVFIRVFKAESELEVWMRRGDTFVLFATYPVCHWSGTIGPKISEGDKQTPEGVYTVTQKQLHMIGRHPRSLNLGFPNAYDKQYQRTGSYILIHGGCSTVGCIAMTNPVIEEIFSLAQAALKSGQDAVQVQVFPFRMTEERLRAHALNDWYDFWRNLKDAYDSFERRRLPPRVSICDGRYLVEDSRSIEEVASHAPLALCGARPVGAAPRPGRRADVDPPSLLVPLWTPVDVRHPSRQEPSTISELQNRRPLLRSTPVPSGLEQLRSVRAMDLTPSTMAEPRPDETWPSRRAPGKRASQQNSRSGRHAALLRNPAKAAMATTAGATTLRVPISCNPSLSSCRKHLALRQAIAVRRLEQAKSPEGKTRSDVSNGRASARGS